MKRTEEQLISLIQEHGFSTVARKYKHHHSSSDLKQICYRHRIGDLPPYQYPHILREELSQGYNPVQIAEKYGTSFTTIYRFMRKYKISPKIRVFTEEEDKYIRFNIGYISVSEIADTLRRPVPSIYHYRIYSPAAVCRYRSPCSYYPKLDCKDGTQSRSSDWDI